MGAVPEGKLPNDLFSSGASEPIAIPLGMRDDQEAGPESPGQHTLPHIAYSTGCPRHFCHAQGTSVPIAIPMGPRDDKEASPESPEEPGGIHAATFVPPHMLEPRSGAINLTNSVHVRASVSSSNFDLHRQLGG